MSEPIYEQLRGEYLMDDIPRAPGASPYPPLATTRAPREFRHDDGSVYGRVDPTDLPNYDAVDSTTIVDPGAPA